MLPSNLHRLSSEHLQLGKEMTKRLNLSDLSTLLEIRESSSFVTSCPMITHHISWLSVFLFIGEDHKPVGGRYGSNCLLITQVVTSTIVYESVLCRSPEVSPQLFRAVGRDVRCLYRCHSYYCQLSLLEDKRFSDWQQHHHIHHNLSWQGDFSWK